METKRGYFLSSALVGSLSLNAALVGAGLTEGSSVAEPLIRHAQDTLAADALPGLSAAAATKLCPEMIDAAREDFCVDPDECPEFIAPPCSGDDIDVVSVGWEGETPYVSANFGDKSYQVDLTEAQARPWRDKAAEKLCPEAVVMAGYDADECSAADVAVLSVVWAEDATHVSAKFAFAGRHVRGAQ